MKDSLSFSYAKISSNLYEVVVKILPDVVKVFESKALAAFKLHVKPAGLEHYDLPTDFIQKKYGHALLQTVQNFGLCYLVQDGLMEELRSRKTLLVHQPRLVKTFTDQDGGSCYAFRISVIDNITIGEWKKYPFKSPKRKLYKDLDKQVEAFCEREGGFFDHLKKDAIEDGDWIEIEVEILDNQENIFLKNFKQRYWFKYSTRYITDPFKQEFIGKKIGDTFITSQFRRHDNFQESLSERSKQRVTILSTSKGNHFSIDMFKTMFNLKNRTEIHKKLIEVFSFRNDISQRKSIVEEVFNLLLSKQRFEIPQHLTLRKQEDILLSLKKMPDYHVYKSQKNFDKQLEKLAEKLLKEEALIDSIAFKENVHVSRDDIHSYLHLFNHDRLREFVYFKPSLENFDEIDAPIPEQIIREAVMREKTLNSVIYQLSK